MVSLSSPSLYKALSPSLTKSQSAFPNRKAQLRVTAAVATPKPAAASAKATMYELLSVPESAGPEEIKAAYQRQARRWHPDACPPSSDKTFFAEQFMRVHQAYEILSDLDRRQDYDLALRIGAAVPGNWSAALGGGAFFRRGGSGTRAPGQGRFGDWESQLVGLQTRAARLGREATWGSKMRSAANRWWPSD